MAKKIRAKKSLFWLMTLAMGFLIFLVLAYNIESKAISGLIKAVLAILSILMILFGLFSYFHTKRKEIFLMLFSLVICLVFLEISLRLSPCRFSKEIYDAPYQFKFMPDTKNCFSISDGLMFNVKSNNDGFMDKNFTQEKEFKIYLLGDSFAECINANYSSCVHEKLEKDLSSEYKKEIDVMNFGIGSYGTLNELGILKEYKGKYKPDMIILYFLPHNDVSDNIRYSGFYYENVRKQKLYSQFWPKSIDFFKGHVANLMALFSEKQKLHLAYQNTAYQNYMVFSTEYDSSLEEGWNMTYSALDEINGIAKSLDIPLVIVIVNGPEQVYEKDWQRILDTYPVLKDGKYDLEKPDKLIKAYAEKKGIYVLDLLPYFKAENKRLHYELDGHWDSEGQEFAEKIILDFINEKKLIKS